MPKILDVSKDKMLDIANEILKKDGYKALSIRKLTQMCNMATGTFYLYFESKDRLVSHAIAKTWFDVVDKMKTTAASATDFSDGLTEIYRLIYEFIVQYSIAFSEYSKFVGSHEILTARHSLLRDQVSDCIGELAKATGQYHLLGSSDILAECVLAVVRQNDMNENTVKDFVKLLVK